MADGSTILLEERALEEDAEELVESEAPPIALKELPKEEPPAPLPDPGVKKRINPNLLYQPFWAKVEQLLRNCEARGVRYYLISGFRSFDEQRDLFAQGRKKPGKIVTNANAGQSTHNYGIACDFCRDKDMDRAGLQPDWDRRSYETLAEEAEKLGLEAGLRWRFVDAPHVQLRIGRHGIDIKDLQKLHATGGQMAVNHLLDKFRW